MTIFNRDNSFLDNNHIKQITVDTTTNDLWIINEGSGVFVFNEQNDIINGVKKPETKRSVAQLKVFPNPFVNETTFDFILSNDEKVSLTVYDLTGKKIKEIFHGYLNKGEHRLRFNGDHLPSGYYFCTLKTSRGTISKKFIKAGGSYR
jgi:myo-inositol-hexaphosphate 3-phosphohydrolase